MRPAVRRKPLQRTISFRLNGKPHPTDTDRERMLLRVLRCDLGLTGTNFGRRAGLCRACSVLVDNETVRACATPVGSLESRRVLTIEGLSREGGCVRCSGRFWNDTPSRAAFARPEWS